MTKEHPIAVCPECGSFIPVGGRAELIGKRCGRKIDGHHGRGVYTTAMNPADWKICSECSGEGIPADTGLPMVVWASERGHARHDVPVEVNQSHGTRILPGNLAMVAVGPAPRLVAGNLSPANLSAVSDWIRLNEAALLIHWEYRISAAQLIEQLRRLPAS